MNVLLDTTVLIDVLRGDRLRIAQLRSLAEHTLSTSVVNVAEVYSGMRPSEKAAVARLFADIGTHPVTAEIAEFAGTLKYSAARKGKTIFLPDALVAATAIKHGCRLMTSNRKDFLTTGVPFWDEPAVS